MRDRRIGRERAREREKERETDRRIDRQTADRQKNSPRHKQRATKGEIEKGTRHVKIRKLRLGDALNNYPPTILAIKAILSH